MDFFVIYIKKTLNVLLYSTGRGSVLQHRPIRTKRTNKKTVTVFNVYSPVSFSFIVLSGIDFTV
jgi:hypothetical protein